METQPNKPGILSKLKTKSRAHVAALSHGVPARHLQVIGVVGQDGSRLSIAYLASILRLAGHRVGVIAHDYVQIADEHAAGSDQADVLGDAFRLQALLAQMRKAECAFVLIELAPTLPAHNFAGVNFSMIVVRRCGDVYLDSATAVGRAASVRRLLSGKPRFIVLNHDDPCFQSFSKVSPGELLMNFGTHKTAECRLQKVRLHAKGSEIELLVDHQTELTLATIFSGKQAIYSAVAAAAAAYLLHAPIDDIQKGITGLASLPNQLEYLPIQRPYSLVLDGSVSPEGIGEQLEALKHFAKNRLIVVVGGHVSQPEHWRPIIGEIVAKAADRAVVTDGEYGEHESPQAVREQFMQGIVAAGGEAMVDEVPDRQAAFEKALSIARRGDILVVVSTTNRPYRQLGTERRTWDDRKIFEELIGG